MSLRAALAEVVGYAHLTNFRFELETELVTIAPTSNTKKSTSATSTAAQSVISPYTGLNAVISVPAQLQSSTPSLVLDEYGDLTSLSDELRDGMGFRIVLERYNAASIKDHISRLRSLLDGNAPTATSLLEGVDGNNNNDDVDPETPDAEQNVNENNGSNGDKSSLPDLKPLLSAKEVVVNGSNLQDFFYLAFGEDYNEIHHHAPNTPNESSNGVNAKTKNKKKKNKNGNADHSNTTLSLKHGSEDMDRMCRWNELEELIRVRYVVQYSGFHPPPAHRRLLGDLAYIAVTSSDQLTVLHVTATTLGFYISRSIGTHFDPSPGAEPHFSHALLDCILSASPDLCTAWAQALATSKERVELTKSLSENNYFSSLFRASVRGDYEGFSSPATALKAINEAMDTFLLTPSWLAPYPRKYSSIPYAWKRDQTHAFSPHRADEETQRTFGIEIRNGSIRDWNEELQLAREMPTGTLNERVDRARLLHKVMTEFGEASLIGVMAIFDGQIDPMNPNEPTRSQVYFHNSIFFSRAVDAGPETFKIAKGDKAARKCSNRDIQCIGTLHRMEHSGIYTLATVLVDYLGTRFVCQSILPGILVGEKSHTLLYGAVETGLPLKWDEGLHKIFVEKIGDNMFVATRPILRNPLCQWEEAKQQNKALQLKMASKIDDDTYLDDDPNALIDSCVPIEAKGILGSDQRRYILDLSRLTPRDANWVPQEQGGTGKFEEALEKDNVKFSAVVPSTLDDDEWTMCVLRSEIVSRFTQVRLATESKTKDDNTEINEKSPGSVSESDPVGKPAPSSLSDTEVNETSVGRNPEPDHAGKLESSSTSDETPHAPDDNVVQPLKFNVNVFLPQMRSLEGIDEDAAQVVKADEQLARDVAIYLWDEVLPKITQAIREGAVHQIPVDGKTLTEFLHRNGVNCRYLGKLATMAKLQEERDVMIENDLNLGKTTLVERRKMPRCWLDLLECEMVARSAKHVLDDYLTACGGVAAMQPAQTISSFLSALLSESEETAAQTEMRMNKRPERDPDDDDVGSLTIFDFGIDDNAAPPPMRSRREVWQDIEKDIGRRFRYCLTIFNRGNKSGRALYIPLLRRVCLRTGVRLLAKNYDVGGKCFCGGSITMGGRLANSFPISPLDITEIVPLMKHAAAYGEGFTPCTIGATIGLPPLQVSLQDARATLERAHIQAVGRALGKGMELAQEAGALYQRVTDSTLHPGVIESIDLMATIFLEAGDSANAAANASKALGLTLQSSGFDSAASLNIHMSLFQILFTAHEFDQAIKHLRAAMYILEIMGGPRHTDHYAAYHKLGTVYMHSGYNGKYLTTVLECFREAKTRDSCDRLMEGFMAKNFAKVLTGLENYTDALDYEKKALRTLSIFLGKNHNVTQESGAAVLMLSTLAEGKGNLLDAKNERQAEAEKADSIAADLAAEEERKKKKPSKKKKHTNK